MSDIETISMMNDGGINISQSRILFRIYNTKIDAKLFESETKMTDLCGEMVASQFSEYKYIHEVDSKPKLTLYWVS